MKKLLGLIYLFLFIIASAAYADNLPQDKQSQPKANACATLTKRDVKTDQLARRGCCSHHGGVCGCQGGRIVCCDGGYSPSCTCDKEEPVEIPN